MKLRESDNTKAVWPFVDIKDSKDDEFYYENWINQDNQVSKGY